MMYFFFPAGCCDYETNLLSLCWPNMWHIDRIITRADALNERMFGDWGGVVRSARVRPSAGDPKLRTQ